MMYASFYESFQANVHIIYILIHAFIHYELHFTSEINNLTFCHQKKIYLFKRNTQGDLSEGTIWPSSTLCEIHPCKVTSSSSLFFSFCFLNKFNSFMQFSLALLSFLSQLVKPLCVRSIISTNLIVASLIEIRDVFIEVPWKNYAVRLEMRSKAIMPRG